MLERVASSDSARAISKSSCASCRPEAMESRAPTEDSRDFFSRPSSWARFWSLHTLGSASSLSTAESRLCLDSRSKIPPQLGRALLEVGERGGDLVDAFRFHGD